MRNLIKTETKATLNRDAREAIEREVRSLKISLESPVYIRLYTIIDNCVNAAYQLGKIDAKREIGV
jgi:hypothetical protein